MTDEPFYAPGRRPTFRRAKPDELLFACTRDRDRATFRCELRDRGDYGVEAQVFDGADLLIGRLSHVGASRRPRCHSR